MIFARLFLIFALSTSLTWAEDKSMEQFAIDKGRIAGLATACGFPKEDVNSYIEHVLSQAKSKWGTSLGRGFTENFNGALRAAEAAPAPDWSTCQGDVKGVMWEAGLSVPPVAQELPSSQPLASHPAPPVLVTPIGTHVCRKAGGVESPIIAYGPHGPIYGKEKISRTFDIEGYTEGSSGNCQEVKVGEIGCRIKVLIKSIGVASRSGYQYIDNLPPNYTKGQYVWEDAIDWRPCY